MGRAGLPAPSPLAFTPPPPPPPHTFATLCFVHVTKLLSSRASLPLPLSLPLPTRPVRAPACPLTPPPLRRGQIDQMMDNDPDEKMRYNEMLCVVTGGASNRALRRVWRYRHHFSGARVGRSTLFRAGCAAIPERIAAVRQAILPLCGR
jgi:hypothetical protein